jgi:hypothetical protein
MPVCCLCTGLTIPALAQYNSGSGEAKETEFRIRAVDPRFIDTPDLSTGTFSRRGIVGGTPLKWLRVEVEFDSTPPWADTVETRWYVLVATEKKPVVFTASVTHINVKRGLRHVSVIFVPPRTVDRYEMTTTRTRQISVQLLHDQKLVDTASWRSEPKGRWWEDFTPVPGYMLNLLQTPFGVLEYDRYEQIKVSPTP